MYVAWLVLQCKIYSRRSLCHCPTGAAAVPDHPAPPRPHDGGTQWQWQVLRLEGPPQGSGEDRGSGGRGPHHRPQGGRSLVNWLQVVCLSIDPYIKNLMACRLFQSMCIIGKLKTVYYTKCRHMCIIVYHQPRFLEWSILLYYISSSPF